MTDAVKQIKEKVKQLPPLSLPQGSSQMVIETDASNKAWGGILIENMVIKKKSAAMLQEHSKMQKSIIRQVTRKSLQSKRL